MKFSFMNDGPVDPVSGNDIPPGGTAEGVRDNIDANLSEGEYIIPANVVRFYGIDKFEKMITKAEDSLAEMETNGRMGEPAMEEGDELPFDVSELQTEQQEPIAMAEGGPVQTSRGGWTPPGFTGFQSKSYVNAAGERRMILFYNGQPIGGGVPEGFFPDTPENRTGLGIEDQTSVAPVSTTGEGDLATSFIDGEEGQESLNVADWTTDDFEDMISQQATTDFLAKGLGLAGPAGMMIGAAMRQGNKMTMNRAAEEIKARLSDDSTSPEDRTRLIAVQEQMSQQSDSSGGNNGPLGGIVPDRGLLGGLLPENGILGGLFKSSRSTENKPVYSPSQRTIVNTDRSTGEGDLGGAPVSSARPSPRPNQTISQVPSVSTRQTAPNPGNIDRSSSSYTAPEEDRDKAGPFKKGGLVTRRKKK